MVTAERQAGPAAGLVLAALGSAAFALAIAVPTLLPGVSFWDTAELQTVGPLLGTAHPTGFPTWVILGWLASIAFQPFGDPAFRMNLLNAVCLAAAAALMAVLVHRLTARAWLAFAFGVILAATPIAWSIGTHADAHGLHLALCALLLIVLVDWERRERSGARGADRRLVAAAVVFGLALGNHSLVLLFLPGIVLFVVAVAPAILRRRRLVGSCLAALAATLVVVYLELPIRAGLIPAPLVYGQPATWSGFWYIVLAQQFQGSLVNPLGDLAQRLATLVRFSGDQLGPLAWLVPLGLAATIVRRPRYALLTGTTLAITVIFAISYDNAEIDRYYLVPALIALSWLAILVGTIVDWLERRIVPGGLDRHGERAPRPVAGLLVAALVVVPTAVLLPVRWQAVDQSANRSGDAWLDAILDERVAGPGAVIVSWWSYSTPLWYAQHIDGRRPDIQVVDDRTRLDEHLGAISDVIDKNLGRHPVLVIQVDPEVVGSLMARYRLTALPVPGPQVVYRVDGVLAAAAR
jgi:transmembrane protein TMEM260 (protein O-mannosyltransferase)